MGPLSRLEVPADTFATLIEQTTLLLGQALLSVSYTHRLNILKTLLKGPRRTKALLREKQHYCKIVKVIYLEKISFTHKKSRTPKEAMSGCF